MNENKLVLKSFSFEFLKYIIAVFLFVFTVFPFLWMLSSSLKGPNEILQMPPRIIPEHITFINYYNAITQNNLLTYIGNSLIITLSSVALTIFLAALTSYAMNFFKYKGSKLFTSLMVMVQVLPCVVTLVPLFIIFKDMGIINTRFSLILAYTASTWGLPISFIFLSGYFTEIPKALHESARIDGCSPLRIFFKIILPLTMPGIIATSISCFIMVWQEFMMIVSLISDKKLYTLPVGLTMFMGMHGTDWGGIMATSVVIAIPSIIMFVSVQNYFVNNLTGSVKG